MSTDPVVHDDVTLAERDRLAELEAVVDRGMQTFVDVGNALMEIRDSRLYREKHGTFAAYCRERWGFSDSRGRQLIAAAKTVTDVTGAGLPAPRTEGEARRLARALREANLPEQRSEVMLEQHPLVRDLLPGIDGWSRFRESIRTHGLLVPIVLYEGKILDGWQRYRACQELGVEPAFTEYAGGEPLELWNSLNLLRKHDPGHHIANAKGYVVQGDAAMAAAADAIFAALNEDSSPETIDEVRALLSHAAWGFLDKGQREILKRMMPA